MRWLLIAAGVLLGLGLAVYLIGAFLPVQHVAVVEAQYQQAADTVYALIENVPAAPSWRSGLERVDVMSAPGEPLRWQEHGSFGTIAFRREEATRPTRIVSVIDDTSQGFGGRWTWELAPRATGTVLRITERGEVYGPLFRFMSRFLFGHYRTMEQYARDVGRHFGEDVTTTRVRG